MFFFSPIINTSPIEEAKEEIATSVKPTSLEGFTQTTQLSEESTSQAFQPTIPTTIRHVLFPLHIVVDVHCNLIKDPAG